MTDEKKIDTLCIEYLYCSMNIFEVTKRLDCIYNFLNICSLEGIISARTRNELYMHHRQYASYKIKSMLENINIEDGGAKDCPE